MDADFRRWRLGRPALHALGVSLLPFVSSAAIAAGALPAGGNFAAGSGKISSSANTLTVNQTTKNGIINWNGFSIGQGDSVRINNGSGATLNRVTGTSPSSIAGSLTSTGSTYLVNQNGIVVTPSGQVITGGSFVATTRDTSNSAFMGGAVNLEFTGTSSGTVTNQGSIRAGGYAVLIGKSATNSGNISAPNGTVGVVAGDDVLLQPASTGLQIEVKTGSGDATTSGTIAAAQALIDAVGGNAYALAGNNGGVVRATGTKTINGHVWLTAPNGTAQVTGTIAAQNANGSGGAINVQGQTINVSGTLNANDVAPKGNGGDITVGSQAVASTTVSGTLDARGGPKGGNGGNIETSGEVLDTSGVKVDTSAPKGQTGNWTLDPYNVTISSAATSNNALSSGTFTPSGNDSVISVTDLQNALQTTNVTVTTGSSGSQTGDITVASPVVWSANVLTFDAWHSVNINAALSAGGTAGLAIKTNDGGSGGAFNLSAGNISFANAGETLTINGVAQTLVTAALTGTVSKTYDGTLAATLDHTNYALAGVAPADQGNVVLTVNGTPDTSPTSGTLSTKNAGTGLLVTVSSLGLSQPAGDDYFLTATTISAGIGTITPASLTVTANPESKVYGTPDPGLSYAVSGLQTGDSAATVLSGSLARSGGESAGAYVINQGSLAANSNYTLSAFTGNSLTITPATLTITANSETRVYGRNDPALTYATSGLVNATVDGDAINDTIDSVLSGNLSRAGYGTLAGEQVGSYAISLGSLAANSNYTIAFIGNSLSITPATVLVSPFLRTKVYGNNDPALGYDVSQLVFGVVDGVAIQDTAASVVSGSLSRVGYGTLAGEQVGSYAITQGSLVANSDYTVALASSTLTITAPTLTVTANSGSKVYGTSDPVFTYSVSGLKDSVADGVVIDDTAESALTGSLARVTGENVGTYAITQGSLAASNYTISFSGNVLAIAPASLTVTANPETKVYGTTDPALTFSTLGLVNASVDGVAINDTAASAFTGSLSRSGGESVGAYAINQGSLAANSNYTLAAFTGNVLTITPATLTITANSETRIYGTNDPALAYATSGLVNATVDGSAINDTADSVLSGNLARAAYGTLAGEQVGSYAITQGNLAANGNYTVAFTGNALSITPATLVISPFARSKVYGNNDPALGYDVSQLVSGVVDGVTIHDTAASVVSGNLSRAGYGTLAGEQVGSYAIIQGSLVANSDYTVALASNALTITAPTLTVTANSGSKVYGTSDPVFTYGVSGLTNSIADGVVIDDTVASALTGSLARAAGENVGSYAITQGSLAASNYTISFNSNALAITPASLTVTADPETKVYGTTDPGLTFSTLGLVNATVDGVTINDTAASAFTGSLSRSGGESVGTYAINQGNLTASSNYTMAFAGNALSVTPATLTITADVQSKVYGTNDPALTYTMSGLVNAPVDGVAISDTADSVLSGGLARAAYETLAGEQVGSYAITQGSLATNGNYSIVFSGNSLSITPATLLVEPNARAKVYGNNDPALSYGVTQLVSGVIDGVAIHDTASSVVSGSLSRVGYGTLAGEQVGSYAIAQGSLAANSDYTIDLIGSTLTITPATLTVAANPQSKTYGTADPVLTYATSGLVIATIDGVAINDTAASALAGSLARATGENVGSYAITQGSLAASNYTISFNSNALAITPASLTVTANPETKVYGTTDPHLTFSTLGLVNATVDGVAINDTAASAFTGSLARPGGESVGTYAINQGNLAANSNYAMAFIGNALSITPVTLTITADAQTKTYGSNDPALIYAASGLVNATVDGVAINDTADSVLSGGLSRAGYGTLAGEQVGSYAITQGNLAASSNYIIAFTGNALSIIPATVAVTANAQSKVYGTNDPALGYDASQLVFGVIDGVAIHDTAASVLSGHLARVAGENVGGYAITQGSLTSNNYSIAFTGNTLNITPATLTVTADAQSKVYGNNDPALTYTTSGFVNATVDGAPIDDTAASALAGSLVRAAGESVGTYAITQGSLTANGNYALDFTANALNIAPATLSITAGAQTKIYGANDPALTYTASGVVSATVDGIAIDDTVTSVLSGNLSRAGYGTLAGEQVGSYAITQGSLEANNNYAIVLTGNLLSITPATVLVSPFLRTKVYGNDDPALGYDVSQLVFGVVDGVTIHDTAASVVSGTLSRAGYGTLAGEQVGSYAITQGSLSANSNYTIAFVSSSLNIAPATLTVAAGPESKIYGDNDPALTYTASGFVNATADGVAINDTAASVLTGSVVRAAGENAGSYAITQGSLAANRNYTIAFTGNSLSITPAVLTVAANAQSKIYGTADPALTYTTTGLVNATADGVAINDAAASVLSGGLARVAGENAGSYAINLGSLAANGNYTIAFTGNSLIITPASLTITATGGSKVYDGATSSGLVPAYTGLVAGDSLTGLTEAYNTKNVNTATTLSVSYVLSDPSNYHVTMNTAAGTITPATLTYVANAQSIRSGQSFPAVTGTVTGFVSGENLSNATTGTAVFATTATGSSPAGSYAINGSGLTANNGNYVFVQAAANATAFTITAVTATVIATGADLTGANLSADNLTSVNFSGADLTGANLNKTNLTDANLTKVDDTGANLNGANLTGATISTVTSYTLPTLTLTTNWAGKNLSGKNLSGMDLAGYDLAGANLKGANLTGANLTGADLAGANLSGAILFGANFTDANLIGANLSGANFQ